MLLVPIGTVDDRDMRPELHECVGAGKTSDAGTSDARVYGVPVRVTLQHADLGSIKAHVRTHSP